ncbi:hypothetical protein NVP1081O_244 [Vibrio phage 1.081.O._10N.286.52.C2]|nr:hypothetical protein NVP1081O_244 [Vibrio phage 1.081.O._10N.286.52.C2]
MREWIINLLGGITKEHRNYLLLRAASEWEIVKYNNLSYDVDALYLLESGKIVTARMIYLGHHGQMFVLNGTITHLMSIEDKPIFYKLIES